MSMNAVFYVFSMFCLDELMKAIEDILRNEHFPIDLAALARAEQSLVAQMSISYFGSFHHGSFLEFITKSDRLLNCLGGRYIGSSEGACATKRRRVLGFICQIKEIPDEVSV